MSKTVRTYQNGPRPVRGAKATSVKRHSKATAVSQPSKRGAGVRNTKQTTKTAVPSGKRVTKGGQSAPDRVGPSSGPLVRGR